jgi:small-conductance mechanosensitive channel
MNKLIDIIALQDLLAAARDWFSERVWQVDNAWQLLAIAIGFGAGVLIARSVRAALVRYAGRHTVNGRIRSLGAAADPLAIPMAWLSVLWVVGQVAQEHAWPHRLITIAVSLLAAWIVIRFTASLVRDPVWARSIAVVAWVVAGLNILDLLDPSVMLLDGIAVHVGGLRLSALTVIRGAFSLAVFLWVAVMVAGMLERRIMTLPTLTPSVQVLFSKLLKIVLVTLAIVIALGSIGIDLTGFAVFTGAVGVGLGFGLQKVVSNLISGVILLLDKSVKPGDVISVGESFGWINSLGARYVSVVTRDGTEYLIPNEELITQQVINWSYSNNEVRLKIPVGISYRADVHTALRLCREAAEQCPRVLKSPAPDCLLSAFGDNSVDLVLLIWINDPQQGILNIRSEVLVRVWEKFRAHGIDIPFPQRDVHVDSGAPLRVSLVPAADEDE